MDPDARRRKKRGYSLLPPLDSTRLRTLREGTRQLEETAPDVVLMRIRSLDLFVADSQRG